MRRVGMVIVLVAGLLPWLWVAAPAYAGIPSGWTNETAVSFECVTDTTGNLNPGELCYSPGTSTPIPVTDGSLLQEVILRDAGSSYDLGFRRTGSGSIGSSFPYTWCVWNPYHSGGADWAFSHISASGSASSGTVSLNGDQEIGNGATWGGPYTGFYIFPVDDPATNYPTEWAIGLAAVCAAADPGSPPVGPSDPPTIVASGVLEPGEPIDIDLIAADHDGEDVTCVIQASTANPYTGTVASGEFPIVSAYEFLNNGIYNVACEADDGVFDDTDPEVGSVRILLRIGSGVDDVLGGCEFDPDIGGVITGLSDFENCLLEYAGACGAWYNIACHFGAALRWAFVPDPAVIDALYEQASDEFPFSVGFEFFEVLGVIEEAMEVSADDPGISITVEVNGEPVVVGFNFPCVYEVGVDTPCSPGSIMSADGESAGSWVIPGDTSAGVADLWGFRDVLRNLLLVGLYIGWAFALFKWAERKLEGGGA